MIYQIQKKLLGIESSIDLFEFQQNMLKIKGWIFIPSTEIESMRIVFRDWKGKTSVEINREIERPDVYQIYHRNPYARKCGFMENILVESFNSYTVWLEYSTKKHTYPLYLGSISSTEKKKDKRAPRIQLMESSSSDSDIVNFRNSRVVGHIEYPGKLYEQMIDVIIPVYNGYEYFEKLFQSISKTKMKYRLILIDDCSPDERVFPYLKKYADSHEEVILLSNAENLGFVQTVNKGLSYSKNHVALVNTDVEVPENWLERLMYPIIMEKNIATSTPYTNCGTICSYPEFGKDNELFEQKTLKEIDDVFATIKPTYEKLPTGIGFCMGMNRGAINKIGLLDADTFGKGYGEENDWCQRAIKSGYHNVHVENLFVYHKHGGSFHSEDKKRYLEENGKKLLEKHPNYNRDVAYFCELDPNRKIRSYVTFQLLASIPKKETIVAFDHKLGGGATAYLLNVEENELQNDKCFCTVTYDYKLGYYRIAYKYHKYQVFLRINSLNKLFEIFEELKIDKIIINELVTYLDLYRVLESIKKYRKMHSIFLQLLIHDFFPICPTVNLLNTERKYCDLPSIEKCENCLQNNSSVTCTDYDSMKAWRENWKSLMEVCDEIVAFSHSSKEIVEKAYGESKNLVVRPHQVRNMPCIQKKRKTTKTLNIGLLGVLTQHKGLAVVKQILKTIEAEELNVRVVLIGSSLEPISSKYFRQTGEYTRDMIPRLVFEEDIDIFLIPSIWPETFSYTTEEIMKMGFPVMCFDIGAPAERVKKYEKGIIIPEINGKAVLKAVKENRDKVVGGVKRSYKKKVLFVVEEETFSSRYRVEHLKEQLVYQGVDSDYYLLSKVKKAELSHYSSVVIYRTSHYYETAELVKYAHEKGLDVFYDIDDFIFEYSEIKQLGFLKGKDYKDFEEYSQNIRRCMKLCDTFITSTETLKSAIQQIAKNRPVYVNRNSASMEMLMLSADAEEKVQHKEEKIVMGYFSGSRTHDADFEVAKNAVINCMRKYQNVFLRVGGTIELPPEFKEFSSRIERFEFVNWKKLPRLIAETDINLMPLENTFFHACKSENKWMEAGIVGTVTIASWNEELERVMRDGENAFLCKNEEEWQTKLEKLIEDKNLRKELVSNAKDEIMKTHTTRTIPTELLNALAGLNDRE